jgi:RNA polymerase sigma-70 factor (ECF subfamily)
MSDDKIIFVRKLTSITLQNVQSATNFAYYKCGDRDAALDLVQDAFTKIWENCSKIDFSKVKTYLLTTVNNLFLNTIKHKSGSTRQKL